MQHLTSWQDLREMMQIGSLCVSQKLGKSNGPYRMKYIADYSSERERNETPKRTVRTEENVFREPDPHRLIMTE